MVEISSGNNFLFFFYKHSKGLIISRILDSSYVLGSDCYLKNAILSVQSKVQYLYTKIKYKRHCIYSVILFFV